MKKTTYGLIAAVFVVLTASNSFATSDQVVQIPYVVNVGGWSTGLAITNLSDAEITGLTLDLIRGNGNWHEMVKSMGTPLSEDSRSGALYVPPIYNYRASLENIAPYAMTVDFLETLYGETLPDDRLWCEIWHTGVEPFAVTVFVMNVTTGQAEGFGFYPFFSENRLHTFPEYTGEIYK